MPDQARKWRTAGPEHPLHALQGRLLECGHLELEPQYIVPEPESEASH